jgi:hypothetical protein
MDMNLFENFPKILSLYLEAGIQIRIRIKIKGRIRIGSKSKQYGELRRPFLRLGRRAVILRAERWSTCSAAAAPPTPPSPPSLSDTPPPNSLTASANRIKTLLA